MNAPRRWHHRHRRLLPSAAGAQNSSNRRRLCESVRPELELQARGLQRAGETQAAEFSIHNLRPPPPPKIPVLESVIAVLNEWKGRSSRSHFNCCLIRWWARPTSVPCRMRTTGRQLLSFSANACSRRRTPFRPPSPLCDTAMKLTSSLYSGLRYIDSQGIRATASTRHDQRAGAQTPFPALRDPGFPCAMASSPPSVLRRRKS